MALWTPYSQEVALDLSRATVKSEPPRSVEIDNSSPPFPDYVYQRYSASPVEQIPNRQPYFAGFSYPPSFSVPSAAISPDSVGSSWSRTLRSPKSINTAPSPPESPELYETESLSDDVEYQAFERDALRAMQEKNGGCLLGNNPRMRRAVQTSQAADDSYRKQRERNNFAAKQSRDRRKLREVRLAFQVTFLKKKMADLRARLEAGLCARCHNVCECRI
ncbi:thyrotroph embryonic factor-like [Plodia interpunctella]|uniref:thyrotroph embryonic factor-like n=1 Tax=Plodia interpunctella TaxID=58824 RepID=UPI0023686A70|nr:thyrotroph embryonic factor-like [Plodia interpunctella]